MKTVCSQKKKRTTPKRPPKNKTVTIKSLTVEILTRSRKPHQYRTKAKRIMTKSIGSRVLKKSVIHGQFGVKQLRRAVVKTFGRKYKRLIKKKK